MTEKRDKSNAYARLSIREQLYLETRAMAEHALSNGKTLPASVIKTIESFTKAPCVTGNEENLKDLFKDSEDIEGLVNAHNTLAKIVAPAKPKTLLMLDMEQKETGFWKFLGPVALVRQMIVVSFICLALFITLSLSGEIISCEKNIQNTGKTEMTSSPETKQYKDKGSIMESGGYPLLMNLLFFLSAAGLGASFAGLYKANSYIADGTFDVTFNATYWIRFLLGLIAGLIIAVMISDEVMNSPGSSDVQKEAFKWLAPGVLRPLLALLGGFSADMVYTVLSRLVETVESLFRGSSKQIITAKIKEESSRLENNQIRQDLKVASKILNTSGSLNEKTDPKEVKQVLNKLVKDIIPDAGVDTEP